MIYIFGREFWLVKINSARRCWGHTVEPPIFYIYGLPLLLTSLMIFFFFLLKIHELAPTRTLPGTFREAFQAVVNVDPREFHKLFYFSHFLSFQLPWG